MFINDLGAAEKCGAMAMFSGALYHAPQEVVTAWGEQTEYPGTVTGVVFMPDIYYIAPLCILALKSQRHTAYMCMSVPACECAC